MPDRIIGRVLAAAVIVVVWPVVWAISRWDERVERGQP